MIGFYKKMMSMQYPETGVMTIAALGDSVTHGAYECVNGQPCIFDFNAVYHNRLRLMLEEKKPWLPISVINAGIAGDRAPAALNRIKADVIDRKPDLCIVMYGLNDFGESCEEFCQALRAIFAQLKENGIETIYMSPNMMNTYVREDTVPEYREYAKATAIWQTTGVVDKYMNSAVATARECGVPCADVYSKWRDMAKSGTDTTALLANAINHPNRDMHKLFAEELYRVITEEQ